MSSAGDNPTRVASFLVIGDWGYSRTALQYGGRKGIKNRRCQEEIADRMDKTMRELGDVKFVVNVGDSFYPAGVTSKQDDQWDRKWRRVYSPELLSVPWYSVYGNHDHLEQGCACADNPRAACAQINGKLDDRSYFYMPDFSWYLEHPELDLEVVALDLTYQTWVDKTCNSVPGWCRQRCIQNQKVRGEDAMRLFEERMAKTTSKRLVVFSHYPTDYDWFGNNPDFLNKLSSSGSSRRAYFSGHRHNTDNTSVKHSLGSTSNWLVGGGGGWSCDGRQQGFVVAELMSDSSMQTYSVLVDANVCCNGAASSSLWP